jgi:hypothetical protein
VRGCSPHGADAASAIDGISGGALARAVFQDGARHVAQAWDRIGIRGIVVHAITEEARKFYIALAFDPCPAEAMTLVVTLRDRARGELIGVPRGIRTPVTAVKGRCPRPG